MYKNQLQEFCQKKKLHLPTYDTKRIGGSSHQPTFISSVKIQYNNAIYGSVCGSKKAAEISVAKKMLKQLDNILIQETQHYDLLEGDIHVLIDMENVHMGDFFEKRKFGEGIRFIGFATENHPSIRVVSDQLDVIETIKSDRRDACDILMIGCAARMADTISGEMIIVTKDHFGHGLVDYIHQINPNITARCIGTTEELGEYLKSILNSNDQQKKSEEVDTFISSDGAEQNHPQQNHRQQCDCYHDCDSLASIMRRGDAAY